jgi:hypothetical protein
LGLRQGQLSSLLSENKEGGGDSDELQAAVMYVNTVSCTYLLYYTLCSVHTVLKSIEGMLNKSLNKYGSVSVRTRIIRDVGPQL